MKVFPFICFTLLMIFFPNREARSLIPTALENFPAGDRGQMARANGIEIWFETFGNKEDPAFLLIMGGCCQGTLWPKDFCERLAEKGFYVIRYDHRDAGYSTCFDFEKDPYDHLDMTKDAVGLLDFMEIKKAHVFGLSLGGSVGQLMAAYFPERVLSLGLIATSVDFEPLNRALKNLLPKEGSLPGPRNNYLEAMDEFLNHPPETFEEELEQRISIWSLLNGTKVPLNFESQRELHTEFLNRLQYRAGLNHHIESNYLSESLLRGASSYIKVPTVIFHGTEDPILPLEHGNALNEQIENSLLFVLDGHGHVPNPLFFDLIVNELFYNTKRVNQ